MPRNLNLCKITGCPFGYACRIKFCFVKLVIWIISYRETRIYYFIVERCGAVRFWCGSGSDLKTRKTQLIFLPSLFLTFEGFKN